MSYKVLTGYLTPADFAAECPRRDHNGKLVKGMSRQQVYNWIKQERDTPGSTNIDVLEVGGRTFVKLKHNVQI